MAKATLFSFNVYLRQDGKVELDKQMVKPEEFQKEMDAGVPEFDGAHSIASMLRYFSSVTDEMMEKSGGYTFLLLGHAASSCLCHLQHRTAPSHRPCS